MARRQTGLKGEISKTKLLAQSPAADGGCAVATKRSGQAALAVHNLGDTQAVADQNLSAVEAALRKGGNRQVSIQRFARLNHLFQTATTGAPSEYNRIEETISLAVLKTISNWIEGVVK
ncbi:MAG: hypothetical protein ACK5TN_00210 [Acidobacteriota bacterium]|jgi:hypothetical protein